MANERYESFKNAVNSFELPATVMEVHKGKDGNCTDVYYYVANEVFKKSFLEMFHGGFDENTYDSAAMDQMLEGTSYYDNMPKDPKFDNLLMEASFGKKHIHTYVDTTKMYGFWTEDILFPIVYNGPSVDDDPDTSYCLFMYTLNKEMDAGKYSTVSPDISSFVIKTCLELRNEKEFFSSMNTVIEDIREYTKAFSAAVVTYMRDERSFNIVAESCDDENLSIKEIFSHVPFEIVESWEYLLRDTNSIIIKDENDMAVYDEKAHDWVETLKENDVHNVVLVPFIHQGAIIGFLYICNFDVSDVTRIKETVELVSFFLASEVANHLFLERLEFLSNVDMLTGVFNRNCMNVNVDELSLKLKINPKPFSVAFCDLNGLKSINDNGGHSQGDKLLVYAADVLKEIFDGDKIYRAGGDEFVIVSFDSKNNFEKKLEVLREKASDPEWLYFAIGYYHDEYNGKLRLAMRYADEAMYKDKDLFYEKYPEKRR